jgi:hypothetical protein
MSPWNGRNSVVSKPSPGENGGAFPIVPHGGPLLKVWLILTAVSAMTLIAASCAQTETAEKAVEAAQAATIASTEAYQDLQEAATQMSGAFAPSTTQPSGAPPIPGSSVVETPDSYIIVQNGQVIIIKKSSVYGYTGAIPPH